MESKAFFDTLDKIVYDARIILKKLSYNIYIEDLDEKAFDLAVLYLQETKYKKITNRFSYLFQLAKRYKNTYQQDLYDDIELEGKHDTWKNYQFSLFSKLQLSTPLGMLYALTAQTLEEFERCKVYLDRIIRKKSLRCNAPVIDPVSSNIPVKIWIKDKLKKVELSPCNYYRVWQYGISSDIDLYDYGIWHNWKLMEEVFFNE